MPRATSCPPKPRAKADNAVINFTYYIEKSITVPAYLVKA